MTPDQERAHDLLDRIPADQMTAALRFLEFLLLDPVSRALATAPVEDEEIGEEEERAVAEAHEWLKHNKPIAHEEVLAEFGLTMEDFERMGSTPPEPNGANR